MFHEFIYKFGCTKRVAQAAGQQQAWIMDAGPVRYGHGLLAKWLRSVPVAARLRLSLRRLRTDDTLRTFAKGSVAQHPVDPLGIGVGVPRLLVGRATGNQEAARAFIYEFIHMNSYMNSYKL